MLWAWFPLSSFFFPFYQKQRSRSQRRGLGWGVPRPPPPLPRRACPSVCLSVCPHLAATAAPLPFVCGSCLSKALPSPPRSSWRFLGTAGRAPLTAHASPAPEAGRESGQGEPRQPHAAGTLDFSCPNKLQTAGFWRRAPMALRARWFCCGLSVRRMPPGLARRGLGSSMAFISSRCI